MSLINHQRSNVFIHHNYCLPAAQLSTTFSNSVTVSSTCYFAVDVQLVSNFTVTPTCLPVVLWPAVRAASLPSGLFPVIYIAAGMFCNRPVLLWCRPGLNAVPFHPRTRRSVLLSISLLLCGDIEQSPGPCHPTHPLLTLPVLTSVLPLKKLVAFMTLYLIFNSTFWRCVKLALNLATRLLLKTVSRPMITASCMHTGTLQRRIRLAVALR
jgi:hypothetical protein